MENSAHNSTIWAIGGGKGGTGKSFLTSCMGTHLAMQGVRTTLIDADLGGANLHSFFGLNAPRHTLADFFEKKKPLQEITVHSGIANLQMIAAPGASMESESINHAQKLKLFRHIRSLESDNILIDLGAGTHVNTTDTFLLADRMIIVTSPEITSLENMYQFIKSVYFRKLKAIFKTHGLTSLIQDIWKNRSTYGIRNLKELIGHIRQSSPQMRDIFDQEMGGFVLYIVLNQVKTPRDIQIGENLKSICMNVLGLPAIYAGYSRYDEGVKDSINKREPFMLFNRLSPVVGEIRTLTNNIIAGTGVTVQRELRNGGL